MADGRAQAAVTRRVGSTVHSSIAPWPMAELKRPWFNGVAQPSGRLVDFVRGNVRPRGHRCEVSPRSNETAAGVVAGLFTGDHRSLIVGVEQLRPRARSESKPAAKLRIGIGRRRRDSLRRSFGRFTSARTAIYGLEPRGASPASMASRSPYFDRQPIRPSEWMTFATLLRGRQERFGLQLTAVELCGFAATN